MVTPIAVLAPAAGRSSRRGLAAVDQTLHLAALMCLTRGRTQVNTFRYGEAL